MNCNGLFLSSIFGGLKSRIDMWVMWIGLVLMYRKPSDRKCSRWNHRYLFFVFTSSRNLLTFHGVFSKTAVRLACDNSACAFISSFYKTTSEVNLCSSFLSLYLSFSWKNSLCSIHEWMWGISSEELKIKCRGVTVSSLWYFGAKRMTTLYNSLNTVLINS